ATGRQGAAMALREVLRELYPAALRAYPDPAEPVPLAILDAIPEPGVLSGPSARAREEAVAAALADAGVADLETVTAAITSLRVAVSETPRRAWIGMRLTEAGADTTRHARPAAGPGAGRARARGAAAAPADRALPAGQPRLRAPELPDRRGRHAGGPHRRHPDPPVGDRAGPRLGRVAVPWPGRTAVP